MRENQLSARKMTPTRLTFGVQQIKNDLLSAFFYFIVSNSSQLNSKIINGQTKLEIAKEYSVSLRRYGNHFCVGCFVSNKHVVTAAQCVYKIITQKKPNFDNFTVVQGLTRYRIEKLHMNDMYSYRRPKTTSHYDYGMVLVSITIIFNPIIKFNGK